MHSAPTNKNAFLNLRYDEKVTSYMFLKAIKEQKEPTFNTANDLVISWRNFFKLTIDDRNIEIHQMHHYLCELGMELDMLVVSVQGVALLTLRHPFSIWVYIACSNLSQMRRTSNWRLLSSHVPHFTGFFVVVLSNLI